jgi:anti-sigma factor RsiW
MATMKCNRIEKMLTEFMNGTLNGVQSWAVHKHLAHCSDCAKLLHDFEKMGSLLRGVPAPLMPQDFDDRLMARVAAIRSKSDTNRPWVWLSQWTLRGQLQTAFAVTALVVVLGAPTIFHPRVQTYPRLAGTAIADSGLVQHCLDQQNTIVATQPLADWTAQNLAGHLDNVQLPNSPAYDNNDDSL